MPASVPLLSPPDRIGKTASVFNFDEKARIYQAGEPLFAKGDSAFYFYKLVHGAVICFKSLPNGRRSIDSFRLAGDVFGFDCDGEREVSAVAVSNVSVRVAHCNAVFLRAAKDRAAGQELLEATKQEIQRVQRRSMLLAMKAYERVASFLLEMSERLGQPDILELPMSRRDIADYLGLTIETVSRAFTQLDKAGLIGRPSRHVALRNSPALKLMTE